MSIWLALATFVFCFPTLRHGFLDWLALRNQRLASHRFASGIRYAHRLLAGDLDTDLGLSPCFPNKFDAMDARLIFLKAKLEMSDYLGDADEFDKGVERVIMGLPSTFVEQRY